LADTLIINRFHEFGGKHCETASLKKLLDFQGLPISEEMLLGLGGGVGFIYWHMRKMPSPFIGTRYSKDENFLVTICKRLGARATVTETSSPKKGYDELKAILKTGDAAICYCDMAYLPYFALPEIAHFGGHAFVVFGLDEKNGEVYVSDRASKPVKVSLEDLQKARGSRFPPFPPKHKLLKIEYPHKIAHLEKGIVESVRDCYTNMLKPPIRNIGLTGMQKWADTVMKWPQQFKGSSFCSCLFNAFLYIEIGGTGGSAFRTMYAKFLEEASIILDNPDLRNVAQMFRESAQAWSQIALSALPNSWSTLKRIRELTIEKDAHFLKQEPNALKKMKHVNSEMNNLMEKAAVELHTDDVKPLLSNLQQNILACHKLESQAFHELSRIINNRGKRNV